LLRYPARRWIGTLRFLWLAALSLATPLLAQTPDAFNPAMGGTPLGLAIQPDSKIFVIGIYTNIAGQGRFNNSRLNPDGTFDWSFFAGGALNPIRAVGLATNGDIYLGGEFVLYGGVDRPYLIRVTGGGGVGIFFTWPNAPTRAIAVQPDGKVIAGGDFTSIGGVGRNYLARLNPDNSVDANFNPSANGSVYSLALQPDGKILVGGGFTSIAGAAQTNLARLNSDGTLDPLFTAATAGIPNVLLVQPDGKMVIGGDYLNTPPGVNYCRRLNADGSLDTNFNPVLTQATSPGVNALALQTDGKIFVGGTFDTLGGVACSNLGRLFPDGSTDTNFNPVVGPIDSLALQPNGRLVFGSPAKLGRLFNTDPATDDLGFDNSSATWTRSGTAPEVWFVTFEVTTNGVDWLSQPNGVRTGGGWKCTGLSLPSAPALVRARGYVAGGNWFDEQLAGWPIITGQPPAFFNRNAGFPVTFSASVIGPGLTYQWLKNGTNFTPAKGYGAQSPSMTLTNVLAADVGQYQLVASNPWGNVTSQVSVLNVTDPYLGTQPVSIVTNAGQTVNFFVGATGTLPLSYQWYKAGAALAGATSPSLTFTNVQPGDAANYFAIITNVYGSRTSSIVSLTINAALPDTFAPRTGVVTAMAVQADGKILLGSSTGQILTNNPIRYDPDGSLDSTFGGVISNSAVNCLAIQTDGKVLVSGMPEDHTHYLWRVNSDGSVDTDFTNAAPLLSGPLNCLAVQSDGKILLGGGFSIGTPAIRTNLARLNPDGTLDATFLAGANSTVYSLGLQADGSILAGGAFSLLNGVYRPQIGRFHSDGSLDTNFNASVGEAVYSLLVQPDGKILVDGPFSLLRLNGNGTRDTNFIPPLVEQVNSLGLQADGKIVIGGAFPTFYGGPTPPRSRFARLNADGTIDPYFFPPVNGTVNALAIQSDGAILVGGQFSTVNGLARTNIARIINPDTASQSLSFNGSTITWRRAGSSPEISYSTFETSADGTNWTAAMAGSRVSGGWQLAGLPLSGKPFVRARGYTVGGRYQGSGWYVESLAQLAAPPGIVVNDPFFGFHSNQFGFNISAASGETIVVEASTDLQTWTALSTNILSTSTFYVTDPTNVPSPQRYYRLRLQ
jgi:uncharacterized delta-60 repeat protein